MSHPQRFWGGLKRWLRAPPPFLDEVWRALRARQTSSFTLGGEEKRALRRWKHWGRLILSMVRRKGALEEESGTWQNWPLKTLVSALRSWYHYIKSVLASSREKNEYVE